MTTVAIVAAVVVAAALTLSGVAPVDRLFAGEADAARHTYDVPEAATRGGGGLYVAVRRFDRTTSRESIRVFRVDSDRSVSELPQPPGGAELDGGVPVALDAAGDRPCIALTTLNGTAVTNRARISCFDAGSQTWADLPDLNPFKQAADYLSGFAVRGGRVYASAAKSRPRSQRLFRLDGAAWTRVGNPVVGKGLMFDINPPAGANGGLTASTERSTRRNHGVRTIERVRGDRWIRLTGPLRSLYPAQTGPAAFAAGHWFVTESLSVTEIRPMAFIVRGYIGGSWRALRPGDLNVTGGFAQGGLGRGARGSLWITWSEQGRIGRYATKMSVFAARVYPSRRRVGRVRKLWQGKMKGFPPRVRVVAFSGTTYAMFEYPATDGGSQLLTDVRLVPLDRRSPRITIPGT